MKPVDGRAVHNSWELPAADPQLVPHRGETESHLRSQKGGRTKNISGKYSQMDRYNLGFFILILTQGYVYLFQRERKGVRETLISCLPYVPQQGWTLQLRDAA